MNNKAYYKGSSPGPAICCAVHAHARNQTQTTRWEGIDAKCAIAVNKAICNNKRIAIRPKQKTAAPSQGGVLREQSWQPKQDAPRIPVETDIFDRLGIEEKSKGVGEL